MKKNRLPIFLFFAFVLACSCASSGGAKIAPGELTGIYTGVIPAADCPGISVVALLNAETGRYKITYQYIDRDAALLTFAGTFSWDRDTGLVVLSGGDLPRYYRAGKGSLTQLDPEGKSISGNFARNYELKKAEIYGR